MLVFLAHLTTRQTCKAVACLFGPPSIHYINTDNKWQQNITILFLVKIQKKSELNNIVQLSIEKKC